MVAGNAAKSALWNRIFVVYSVSALVCVVAILASFRLLLLFEFTAREAAAGSLALLFATTFLHYTQHMQENNYLLLLTLAGLGLQYEWATTCSKRALLWGRLASGANLLTRLTTALEWLVTILFLRLFFWFGGMRGSKFLVRGLEYAKTAIAVFLLFLGIDRAYNFYRFESWTTTYISVFGVQYRMLHPEAPPSFPFSGSLLKGLAGPFLVPEKSIFLFDPLILATIALAARFWARNRAGDSRLRALAPGPVAELCPLLCPLLPMGRRLCLGRPLCLHAGPVGRVPFNATLLLRYRRELRPFAWKSAVAVLVVGVAIQIESTVFWYSLEPFQMWTLERPTFVVGLRARNIVASTLGKSEAWA